MHPLSKYLLCLAAVASVVFTGYLAFSDWMPAGSAAGANTPQWKMERLARDPATPVLATASLSPIYPATPGKELLGKAVIVAVHAPQKTHGSLVGKSPVGKSPVGKSPEKPVRLALPLNKLPRNFFTVSAQDKYQDQYAQQSLGYAFEQRLRPERISLGHGIY